MYSIYKYLRGLVASEKEFDDANDEANDESIEESIEEIEFLDITEADIIKEPPKLMESDLKKIEELGKEFPDLLQANEKNLLGTIIEASGQLLEIKFEQGRNMRIRVDDDIKTECTHAVGDRVLVQCLIIINERTDDQESIQIIGIKPAYKRRSVKCTVLEIFDDFIAMEHDSFISKSNNVDIPDLSVGDTLYADLIESKMNQFKWRGIRFTYVDTNTASELMVQRPERTKMRLKVPGRLVPPPRVGRWYNYQAQLCEYAQQVGSQNAVEILNTARKLSTRRFRAVRIGIFEVPSDLRDTYLKQYENIRDWRNNLEQKYATLKQELTFENYRERFSTLLWLEETELFKNFRRYDCERAKFTREFNYLALTVPELAERRPSIIIGDRVRAYIIKEAEDATEIATQRCFEGIIVNVMCDKLLIRFDDAFQQAYDGTAYRLEFFFSRISFRRKHYSVMRMIQDFKRDFLFPNELQLRTQPQMDLRYDETSGEMHTPSAPIRWYNTQLNKYQQRAVFNVLRGETDMMPYIIYGPPGTGKTITVIETILQLVGNFPKARILVAAPSNSAANLICTRLIEAKALHVGELVRLVSYNSIERDQLPEAILKYCATVDMGEEATCETEMITREDGIQMNCPISKLSRFPVTVGTCSSLGKYMELGFPRDHFTHVIIDEAGQCTEPDAMTVISLVSKTNGQVVLAGDPKQLSGIVISKYAKMRGLSKSFLERLLERKPYCNDYFEYGDYDGFNPILVTELLPNYRALPSILRIYSYLFYDMKLEAMISEKASNERQLLEKVKHIHFASEKRSSSHGAFFYAVRGENMRDRDSPSWYNPREANVAFQMTYKLYGAGLKPDNIGIIAPYAKQARCIRNLFLEAKIKPPKIGSVEEFQGQERDVILLSTVRTSHREMFNYDYKYSLGFLTSERRFNVAISRARALLIVLGDPDLLKQNAAWGIYLNECHTNYSYYGTNEETSDSDNKENNSAICNGT